MRRKTLIILGVLIAALAVFAGAEATPRESSPGQPSVKVVVNAARTGSNITYYVTLINESQSAAKNVYLASNLPSGTKFTTAASASAGSTQGGLDGNVVAWLVNEIPAKGTVGPFTLKVTSAGGDIGPVQAWARWISPSQGSAVSTAAVAEYELAKMRAVANWEGEVYPDKKVAITLSKGYGVNLNNNIITSGLPNVAVGGYAYLEGRAQDAAGVNVISWSWQMTQKPNGSKAVLEGASTQYPRFLADYQGEYVIQVTATNASFAKSSSSIKVSAGRYAGSSLCVSCHNGSVAQDIAGKWSGTNHSKKFEIQYASYSATSDYCARCHTLGYDETANNGGMDEAARASGWDPSKGPVTGWLKDGKWTIEDVKADANMASKINIQCENCHGPGGTSHTQAKSFEPGVCNQCHDVTHGNNYNMWKYSGHNANNDYQKGNASCVKCHTAQGFVEVQVRGNDPVFPADAAAGKPANLPQPEEMSKITCVTCHDPHQATDPYVTAAGKQKSNQLRKHGEVTAVGGWTVDAGESAICVSCHNNNRTAQHQAEFIAGSQQRGTHGNTQSNILYGKGAFDYGLTFTNSAHTTVTEGCVTCHMAANPLDNAGPDGIAGNRDDEKVLAVGGHSFNTAANWTYTKEPQKGEVRVENTEACKGCHGTVASFGAIKAKGDYDGDGTTEGVQDEVQGLLAVLGSKLPKNAQGQVLTYPISNANSTAEQRKALWNWSLVSNDGSKGIHNVSFTVQLLQKTYKQLTGSDVPGATLR